MIFLSWNTTYNIISTLEIIEKLFFPETFFRTTTTSKRTYARFIGTYYCGYASCKPEHGLSKAFFTRFRLKTYLQVYHLDQKVLGLVTVWRSRSADFNSSSFVVLVEVSLTFCQIFSLIAWHLWKWCCIVYIYLCVWFRFFSKKNVINFAATSLH